MLMIIQILELHLISVNFFYTYFQNQYMFIENQPLYAIKNNICFWQIQNPELHMNITGVIGQ